MLQIYNTLHRCKQVLRPLHAGRIDLYVCGVTVYDDCHVGHARSMAAFDVVVRCLRMFGWQVRYVRNITDIDDKILQRAEQTGQPYQQLTAHFIRRMHEDWRTLGLQPPDAEPCATSHIEQMIAMIDKLLRRGNAYRTESGDVYYSVASFSAYGRLSGRRPEELWAGARVVPNEQKREPGDFALWKASAPGDVGWDTPWGRGRPGWHIECSAMSVHCLGESFDIHGGGPDLVFPHHENEIAQAEAATGKPFARVWMHTGAVRVAAKKMSKSTGNFVTVRELLEHHCAETVRYFLLASHYRSPVEYAAEHLQTAHTSLQRCYQALQHSDTASAGPLDREEAYTADFCSALEDDFNVPEALAVMFAVVRELNRCTAPAERHRLAGILRSMGNTLGFLQQSPEHFLQSSATDSSAQGDREALEIEAQIAARQSARENGLWEEADRIRRQLEERGIQLQDRGGKTTWRRL